MGVLICDMCNEYLPLHPDSLNHVCESQKIKDYVKWLQENARTAERKWDKVQDEVYKLLIQLPSLESETIEVKSEWLQKIWEAADCRYLDATTAKSFLVKWILTHRVLCEAFSLFQSAERNRGTTKEKLAALKEVCDEANVGLGYDKDRKFPLDLTPEDIIKKLGEES